MLQVFKHYFEELEEESLRDNFVVVVRCAYHRLNHYKFLTLFTIAYVVIYFRWLMIILILVFFVV